MLVKIIKKAQLKYIALMVWNDKPWSAPSIVSSNVILRQWTYKTILVRAQTAAPIGVISVRGVVETTPEFFAVGWNVSFYVFIRNHVPNFSQRSSRQHATSIHVPVSVPAAVTATNRHDQILSACRCRILQIQDRISRDSCYCSHVTTKPTQNEYTAEKRKSICSEL